MLDRLSQGRVILGMGRGFRGALFTAFEVPATEKRDRFDAALAVMRRAWAGEPVAWEDGIGEGTDPTPVRVSPLPVQQPHPPLWVAAFGPKAVEQAGRLGLPYLASPIESLAALEANYARHREALAGAAVAVPVMRTLFVSRDAARVERARPALAQQAAALAKAPAASLRRAAAAAPEDWAIAGGPDEVAEGVRRYREKLGITHLIARVQIPGLAREEIEASLHELAEISALGARKRRDLPRPPLEAQQALLVDEVGEPRALEPAQILRLRARAQLLARARPPAGSARRGADARARRPAPGSDARRGRAEGDRPPPAGSGSPRARIPRAPRAARPGAGRRLRRCGRRAGASGRACGGGSATPGGDPPRGSRPTP